MMEEHEGRALKLSLSNNSLLRDMETCGIGRTVIDNPRKLAGSYTLEKSILSKLSRYADDGLDYFLCSWLEDSINIFNVCQYHIELHISNSIDPFRMIKVELIKLNNFFDAGDYSETKTFYSPMITEELHELYSSLLYGEYQGVIGLEDGKAFQGVENKEGKSKADLFKETLQDDLTVDWWLSIRIQVLLWVVAYLEELSKKKDFKDIYDKFKRENPYNTLVTIQRGFNIASPDKTVPALHDALIAGGLIGAIELQAFKDAFIQGQGCIDWIEGKDKLGYLIKKLKSEKVITTKYHMATAARVFKATDGQALKAGGLSSGADLISDTAIIFMDKIINKCLLIAD